MYIHNDKKENFGKIDSSSDEGTFVGYSPQTRAYMVYNHRFHKVEENIHVIFDEEVMEGNLIKDKEQSPPHFEDEFTLTENTHVGKHDATPTDLPQDP